MWAASEPIYRLSTGSPARAWRSRDGRYRLVGSRCDECDLNFFPKRRVCPKCHSRKLSERACSRTGAIVTLAEDRSPLMGHTGRARRPFAIIQLDDGPSVLAEIVDAEFDRLTPGQIVELVVRKWRREANGLYQYGFKFRPRGVR